MKCMTKESAGLENVFLYLSRVTDSLHQSPSHPHPSILSPILFCPSLTQYIPCWCIPQPSSSPSTSHPSPLSLIMFLDPSSMWHVLYFLLISFECTDWITMIMLFHPTLLILPFIPLCHSPSTHILDMSQIFDKEQLANDKQGWTMTTCINHQQKVFMCTWNVLYHPFLWIMRECQKYQRVKHSSLISFIIMHFMTTVSLIDCEQEINLVSPSFTPSQLSLHLPWLHPIHTLSSPSFHTTLCQSIIETCKGYHLGCQITSSSISSFNDHEEWHWIE